MLTAKQPRENQLVDEGIERAILACLMKEPSKMNEAFSKIKDEDFVNENNRYLFSIMSAVFSKNGGKNCSFDMTTLLSLAKQRGVEEDFIVKSGGTQYIEFLTIVKDSMVSVEKFDQYLYTLLDFGIKRKLYAETEAFKNEITNSGSSPEELIVQQQSKINDLLLSSTNRTHDIRDIGKDAGEFVATALERKKDLIGLHTGYSELDRHIEGLRRKTLTIICAPKKTGKTAFLTNIGINIGIKRKVPTLLISTEMSDEEIMIRILSNLSGVYQNNIVKGQLRSDDSKSLQDGIEEFENGKFFHVTMRDFTMEKIIASVRKFVHEKVGFEDDGKVKDCLVLFDYIKMPQTDSKSKELKEYKVLGQIADGLKQLAGNLDIPILTACQTNRSGEVANSYELTWFCDTFAELTKKTQKEQDKNLQNGIIAGNQRLKITANRSGEENHDGINFDYNGATTTYIELATKNDIRPEPADKFTRR